jgi:hypothetical protein
MRQNTVRATVCWIVCFGSAVGLWGPWGNQGSSPALALSWTKVTEHTAFEARDSAGELVYDGKMWLMGGWNRSDVPSLGDVWNSTDGANWTCVPANAPWTHVDIPVTMVYNNKMWFMSGWADGRMAGAHASNEVWYSTNGANWTETTAAAPWTARLGAAGTVCNGKMWIMGGTTVPTGGGALFNDVWSSSDGANWTQVTAHAPWSARAYHQVLSFNNKLWLLGGGNYQSDYWSSNEVWSSTDGAAWTKVTSNIPWGPRIWFSAEVYDGRMWVLGGSGDTQLELLNDVWSSADGINWTQMQAAPIWDGRHEQSTYAYDGKLWVVGGSVVHNGNWVDNDVWQINAAAPEPNSTVLLGIGLAAVSVYLRRHRSGMERRRRSST